MRRFLVLVILSAAAVVPAPAQDAAPPDPLDAVKKAVVAVRVQGEGWTVVGSGFVVAADPQKVLIATTHQVAIPRPTAPFEPAANPPAVTVTFGPGTPAERSYPAEVAAADRDNDLAVLRVAGVKDPPRPVAYADAPKPAKGAAVSTLGFPTGRNGGKGAGLSARKSAVSDVRTGDDGEIEVIQFDGSLEPGKSGGPVVDEKGRLVGVGTAVVGRQGVGLAVPAAELAKVMRGRVGVVQGSAKKGADGRPVVRVRAELIDPAGGVKSAAAYYIVLAPNAPRPRPEGIDKQPGSKKVALAVEKGVASGEFSVDGPGSEVYVQVIADVGDGKTAVSRVRSVSLAEAR